jgi:hypothetical protein
MTGRPASENSVSHICVNAKRVTSDDAKLLDAWYREQPPAVKAGLNANIIIIMQSQRGVGWNGALELLFKVGRYLNEHEVTE